MYLPGSPYGVGETLRLVLRMAGVLVDRRPGVTGGRIDIVPGAKPRRAIGLCGDILPLLWRGGRVEPEVTSFFADCDAVVGNLEGILTERAWLPFLQKHRPAIFEVLASVAPSERWVLSVANNHAPDYGARDFERTVRAIEAAGMRAVGTAERPCLTIASGVTVTAWTTWANRAAPMVARADPGAPRQPGVHLAFVHWGYELERMPRARQRSAIPRGYQAVVGHHSHLPQPIELHEGQLVAWSLGNFVTEVKLHGMGEGLALKLWLSDDAQPRLCAAEWRPIAIDRRDPRLCGVALG